MDARIMAILNEDADIVVDQLDQIEVYSFQEDMNRRQKALGLNDPELARRCCTSHTTIQKYRTGKAVPRTRESYKELAMGLKMVEEDDNREISSFLVKNGYYPVNVRNPLDSIMDNTLLRHKGADNQVELYRDYISKYGFEECKARTGKASLTTTTLNLRKKRAIADAEFTEWIRNNQENFTQDGLKQDYNDLLTLLLRCYIGNADNIHVLSILYDLSMTLRDLLYAFKGSKPVGAKNLREKLVAIGIYFNMTEEEIDVMLDYARLPKMSESGSKLENAIRCIISGAHLRYPLYEYENNGLVTTNIEELIQDGRYLEFEKEMTEILSEYKERGKELEMYVKYYEDNMTEEDELFEDHYTGRSSKGLMDYVLDMLRILVSREVLTDSEAKNMCSLLKRRDMDDQAAT